MIEVEEKHKTSVNDVSKESQVSPVTDLKHHFLVITIPSSGRWFYYKINEEKIENSVSR